VWLDVPAVPDTFVVNIGDLMMRWTNDRWISTPHRVLNPPRDETLGTGRISLVSFHQPNYDALIECLPSCTDPNHPPRYEPVTSGEHRLRKFLRTAHAQARRRNSSRMLPGLRDEQSEAGDPSEPWVRERRIAGQRSSGVGGHAIPRSARVPGA
jgi:hypothetical protein